MSKLAASSSPSLPRRQHAIYGLYLSSQPAIILYAGSWRVATLDERLHQHRDGECQTTAKMAARASVDTTYLRMRVLAYWMSGVDPNPENEVTLGLQVQGWCRWNHPHAFSTEDCQKGAREQPRDAKIRGGRNSIAKMTPEQLSERGRISMAKMPHEDHVRAGYKTKEGWGRTPEAQEQRLRAGRIGSRKAHEGGWLQTHEGHIATQRGARITNCFRWHSDRPKVDRLCAECAAKRSNG